MSTLTPNNNSTNLAVPKLHDDRSNWADYEPRLRKAMGSRGLWRHVEGVAVVPKLYLIADGIPVLADGKTTVRGHYVGIPIHLLTPSRPLY